MITKELEKEWFDLLNQSRIIQERLIRLDMASRTKDKELENAFLNTHTTIIKRNIKYNASMHVTIYIVISGDMVYLVAENGFLLILKDKMSYATAIKEKLFEKYL